MEELRLSSSRSPHVNEHASRVPFTKYILRRKQGQDFELLECSVDGPKNKRKNQLKELQVIETREFPTRGCVSITAKTQVKIVLYNG